MEWLIGGLIFPIFVGVSPVPCATLEHRRRTRRTATFRSKRTSQKYALRRRLRLAARRRIAAT